jgi:predicted O-methyltransferase YrrM
MGGEMMRWKVGAGVFVLVASVAVAAGAVWAFQSEGRLGDGEVRAFLDGIHGKRGMMNVPRVDGEFLHDFIIERGYKRGLEIGTSNGYSAIWMGMALRKTGGKLVTLEIDKRRASLARKNFARVGFAELIELREGDALEIIPGLSGPFDFVFIDAWKPDYIRYFRMVFSKVRAGGAIFAHNVLSHGSEMREFLEAIEEHPDLETWIERRSRAGISVSVKRQ